MKRTIKLNTIPKVKAFVDDVSKLDGNVDVYLNRYIVDGTSILGILSLDLSRELVAEYIGDEEGVVAFAELMRKYEI